MVKFLKYSFLLTIFLLLPFFFLFANQAFADSEWNVVPGANNGPSSTMFSNPTSVAKVSATDVWMVGSYYPANSSTNTPLIEHWDGTQWSIIPGADLGTDQGQLSSVTAISSNDVWAVGAITTTGKPLIEHWNGTQWSIVQDTHIGGYLNAITAISSTDIWATGVYVVPGSSTLGLLMIHWNGTSWTDFPVTLPDGDYSAQAYSLSASASDNIWAVGRVQTSNGTTIPLVIYWNGSYWNAAHFSSIHPDWSFSAVKTIAGNDIWVVGGKSCHGNNTCALTVHSDGNSWIEIPTPDTTTLDGAGATIGGFGGITALASDNIWAVGGYFPNFPNGGQGQPLIEHWNGTQWHIVPNPYARTNYAYGLSAVTAVSATDIWAIGYFHDPARGITQQELIEHYTATPFDVFKNGYSFANKGLKPDWNTYVSTYGDDQVNGIFGVNKGFAKTFFEDTYFSLIEGGNCFGMAATSLLFYTNNGNQSLIPPGSMKLTHELDKPATYSAQNSVSKKTQDFWKSTPVTEYIASYQGWATSKEFLKDSIQTPPTNLDFYTKIKQNLQSGSSDPLVIGLTDLSIKDAHAVVPYKVEESADGTKKIYVYDPNDPCKPAAPCENVKENGPDPYNRFIKINSGTNPSLEYDIFSDNKPWVNPTVYTVPTSHLIQKPTLPILLHDNRALLFVRGASDILINNFQENSIGYKSGVLVKNIIDAYILLSPLANGTKPIPSYSLPEGAYTILVQGTQTENNNIDIFGSDSLLQVANLPVATGSADTIAIDDAHRSMTITTEESRKTYDANLLVKATSTATKEFNLTGLTIAKGETQTVDITSDSQSVEITNSGVTQNVHLTVKQAGEHNGTLPSDQQITVKNGDKTTITPTDWDNLNTAGVKIQVDNNGTTQSSYRDITSASLSPAPDSDGKYPSPTTVTLSATASGATIANTYYTIDGGSQQTYVSPFTVASGGTHTIKYWSVDSAGVVEDQNAKSFEIIAYTIAGSVYVDANQNGVQDSGEPGHQGATVKLSASQTTTTNASGAFTFSSLQQGNYTVTLTVPAGYTATTANPVSVPLTANATVNFGIAPVPTNTPTPTATPTPTPAPKKLTALSPAKVWIGLPDFFSAGAKFDVKAEVYKDTTLISSGQLNSVDPGLGFGGFSGAKLNSIPFGTFSPVDFPQGAKLIIKLYARTACTGSQSPLGKARLWYNDSQANSNFGVTFGTSTKPYYLGNNFILSTIVGSGPKLTADVTGGNNCSAFKPFGAWSITP